MAKRQHDPNTPEPQMHPYVQANLIVLPEHPTAKDFDSIFGTGWRRAIAEIYRTIQKQMADFSNTDASGAIS